jgi:hypothetical protein
MTDLPHFSYPFRFGGPAAAVSEQDSLEEIADCCAAILLCPLGYRDELPEFGLPPQTFATAPDLDEIRGALDTWEPRAASLLAEDPLTDADPLLAKVEALISVRTQQ